MHISLISHIQKFVTLTPQDELAIAQAFKPLTIKKKDFLLKEGQVCKVNYFVEQGCLRMYYINEKGIEQTTQFALEGWWLADYMSWIKQAPASFYIQSVEASQLQVLDIRQQDELLARVPAMERYFRIITQRAYAAMQNRVKYFSELSKEEAFWHFADAFPDFLQRIPQYMLASYLGLTPEYLSELRKKKRSSIS